MVRLSSVVSEFGSLDIELKDIVHKEKLKVAKTWCDYLNYEISITGMELTTFDENMYYNPDTATVIESHLLKHFSEVIHAVVEEDGDNVRIRVIMPEMEISDKVMSCFDMAWNNTQRRVGGDR